MNYVVQLLMELLLVFSFIAALMAIAARLAWNFWYYVRAARNPIGKTVLTCAVALWLICAGVLAIV